ncbi:hypothetical protein BJ741DRAFT_221691 [Chytriomyces cf. hyalinus JEL632]|nr:hypothetical protein BJ741DRAFT_221691 [Chytriomyces cf. hyalinus JEL632]
MKAKLALNKQIVNDEKTQILFKKRRPNSSTSNVRQSGKTPVSQYNQERIEDVALVDEFGRTIRRAADPLPQLLAPSDNDRDSNVADKPKMQSITPESSTAANDPKQPPANTANSVSGTAISDSKSGENADSFPQYEKKSDSQETTGAATGSALKRRKLSNTKAQSRVRSLSRSFSQSRSRSNSRSRSPPSAARKHSADKARYAKGLDTKPQQNAQSSRHSSQSQPLEHQRGPHDFCAASRSRSRDRQKKTSRSESHDNRRITSRSRSRDRQFSSATWSRSGERRFSTHSRSRSRSREQDRKCNASGKRRHRSRSQSPLSKHW